LILLGFQCVNVCSCCGAIYRSFERLAGDLCRGSLGGNVKLNLFGGKLERHLRGRKLEGGSIRERSLRRRSMRRRSMRRRRSMKVSKEEEKTWRERGKSVGKTIQKHDGTRRMWGGKLLSLELCY
jgi:hypothetical protein